jgi:hypothetical protein
MWTAGRFIAVALLCWLGATSSGFSQPVGASVGSGASGYASVEGVVVDSLRGGTLRDATIMVAHAGRLGVSDPVGRFRIDSIPPGSHRLWLYHAFLDTVGVSVMTEPLTLAAGTSAVVAIAIPSAESIRAAACSNSARGESAVIGRVLDAESAEPLANASVSLGWLEASWSPRTGFRLTPYSRDVITSESGAYRICGLPADLEATLAARAGTMTTAAVPVIVGGAPLVIRTLRIPSAEAAPLAEGERSGARENVIEAANSGGGEVPLRRGRASVTGQIIDRTGEAIPGARVSVIGAAGAVLSDTLGRFTLDRLPPGTQSLLVRRLGFVPLEMPVELSTAAPLEMAIEMAEYIPVLEEVRVRADPYASLDGTGFYARMRMGGGGKFITLEDIEQRKANRLIDLFQGVPGITYTSVAGTRQIAGLRGRCMNLYIDGYMWHHTSPDDDISDFVLPEEVGAIEIHSATSVPPQFARKIGHRPCGAIMLWTRVKMKQRLRPAR